MQSFSFTGKIIGEEIVKKKSHLEEMVRIWFERKAWRIAAINCGPLMQGAGGMITNA